MYVEETTPEQSCVQALTTMVANYGRSCNPNLTKPLWEMNKEAAWDRANTRLGQLFTSYRRGDECGQI